MQIQINRNPQAIQVLACLFLVYLSWGSGYLGIHYAIQSFPPFMMVGIRMMCAGILLFLLCALRGNRNIPTKLDIQHSLVLAFFMVFLGAGLLAKGQETVASGIAALILGSVPIWMTIAGWLFYAEKRPALVQCLGLFGGFSGLLILSIFGTKGAIASFFGISMIFIAAFAWVFGSFYSKRNSAKTELSTMQSSGLFMFLGGIQSLVFSFFIGEMQGFDIRAVPLEGFLAIAYTIVFGAVIGFTCYFWLLLHTRTIVAISYEFVTPIIGVFLGWGIADEPINLPIILACVLTTISVFFVVAEGKD